MNATTIGIDIAKSVFQVHGVDAVGQVTMLKKLRRAEVIKFFEAIPACLVGMEACATAHFWAPGDLRAGPSGAADTAFLRKALYAPTEER